MESEEYYRNNFTELVTSEVNAVVELSVNRLPEYLIYRVSTKWKAGGNAALNRLINKLKKVNEIEVVRSGNSCCIFVTLKIQEMINNKKKRGE